MASFLYSIIILLIGRDVLFVDIDLLSLVGNFVALIRPRTEIEQTASLTAKGAKRIFLGVDGLISAVRAADFAFLHGGEANRDVVGKTRRRVLTRRED